MADLEVGTLKEGATLLLAAILAGLLISLYYAWMNAPKAVTA